MQTMSITEISITIVFFLAVGLPAAGAVPSFLSTESLCRSGESEYVSCVLQDTRKIVCVFAAGNSRPDVGYVQNRYETHKTIEFQYPRDPIAPQDKMTVVDVSRLRDGLGSHLKFRQGSYEYVVSNALVPGEVYVAKDGKTVFDKICRGSEYLPFDDAARSGLPHGVVDPVDRLDRHDR
jgi:hypothetical protein